MGKEKIIGALIFLFALLLLIYYTWGLLILEIFPDLRTAVETTFAGSFLQGLFAPSVQFLLILPIYLGVLLIAIIAMWIGWTMITTPAPEPLEDFDFDEETVAEDKPEE
jgi:hypothetical protein